MADSGWALGSGFALDGATVTVESVEFGYNMKLGENACAHFNFTNVVDADGEDAEDADQWFSVGKNFKPNKAGDELVGTGKINKNTNFGRLLMSALELFDSEEEAREAVDDPRQAECWAGTRWTLGTITVSTTNPTTGEKRDDAQKFVFKAYHGKAGDADEAPAKPAAKKAAAPAAKKVGGAKPATGNPAGLEQDEWDQLVALAAEHDDEDAFQDAALELTLSKDAQKAIMKGTVWAAK